MNYRRQMLEVLKMYKCESVVEVGVNVGKLARVLVNDMPQLHWFGVDHWVPYEGKDQTGQASQREMNQRYEHVKKIMRPFRHRTLIIRNCSIDAARKFDDESVDAVIIDANHLYDHVKEDIKVWFPKVKKVMLWHDYGARQARLEGVKRAVDEFAKTNNLNIIVGVGTVAWTLKAT